MNHRTTIAYLTILVLICVSLSQTFPSYAQGPGFTETFDDPSLPGWEHSPNATVANGVLRIESGGFAFHGGNWSDLTLSVMLRLTGNGAALIKYRATDQAGYIVRFAGSSLVLQRESGGAVTDLGSAKLEIPPGEPALVDVTVLGGQHQVSVNGNPKITASDPQPLPAGGLLLSAEGARAEFDEVTLTASGGVAPTAAATEAPATAAPVATTQAAEPTAGASSFPSGSWVRLGGPPGGLGYDIRMNPDDPDKMVVTDAFSGIFLSRNGGKSWVASDQGMETTPGGGAPIFCATIDPHDPNIIWAGTQLTGHLFRSIDGGQTWEERDNGVLRVSEDMRSFRGITIDPNDPNVVYSALELSLSLESSERQTGWKGGTAGEVYKSTDGGLNWNRIWFGPSLARYVWVDPRNSNRLYVSTGIFDRDTANRDVERKFYGGVGILRSDDGGQTWTELNERNGLGGLYIPSLFMHPENPDTLLAAVTVNRSFGMDPSINIGTPGVYVTYDGGTTWKKILGDVNAMDAVEIATSNPDVWYAATENTIFRSDDAGKTWQRFDMFTPDRKAGVPIDLQVDPRDPFRIFTNNYNGGNMVSTDGGQTWVDASNGYTGARIHAVAVVPGTDGGTVLANEFRSEDGGMTWVGTNVFARSFEIYTPKGGTATRIMAATSYGTVTYSDDGGKTWSPPVQAGDTLGRPLSPRLAVAPSNPDVLYIGYAHWNCMLGGRAGGGGLMPYCQEQMPGLLRSQDGGQTWDPLQTTFGSWSVPSLAVRPDDPQNVFAGTVQGLYVSRDGGSSWERVTSLDDVSMATAKSQPEMSQLEDPTIWDLAFDPFDPQVLYAATFPGGLYRSKDGGASWEQIVAGMDPNEPVDDILPDPKHQGTIYAGSRFSGVFMSTDGGETWQAIVNGMERKEVSTLGLADDGAVLYAGTASGNGGAGVWRLGDLTAAQAATAVAAAPTAQSAAPAPTATPKPEGGGGLCGAAALPLALVGLLWLKRRK